MLLTVLNKEINSIINLAYKCTLNKKDLEFIDLAIIDHMIEQFKSNNWFNGQLLDAATDTIKHHVDMMFSNNSNFRYHIKEMISEILLLYLVQQKIGIGKSHRVATYVAERCVRKVSNVAAIGYAIKSYREW